jgi:hypothetical protein
MSHEVSRHSPEPDRRLPPRSWVMEKLESIIIITITETSKDLHSRVDGFETEKGLVALSLSVLVVW